MCEKSEQCTSKGFWSQNLTKLLCVKRQQTHEKHHIKHIQPIKTAQVIFFFVLWPEATKEKLMLIISQSMCHFPVVN